MPRRRFETNPSKVVGYLRASTAEQVLSPVAQRDAIGAWCERQDLELVDVAADEGVSGATSLAKRPGLLEAMAMCRDHGAGVLAVTTIDRLSRDVRECLTIREMIQQMGVQIAYVQGQGIEEDTPDARLMSTMLAAFAQFEREKISMRTAVALRSMKTRGKKWNGTPPYGYRFHGRRCLADADEQIAVGVIFRLRNAGKSYREIVAELELREDCPARGGSWHVTSVRRVLARGEPH